MNQSGPSSGGPGGSVLRVEFGPAEAEEGEANMKIYLCC